MGACIGIERFTLNMFHPQYFATFLPYNFLRCLLQFFLIFFLFSLTKISFSVFAIHMVIESDNFKFGWLFLLCSLRVHQQVSLPLLLFLPLISRYSNSDFINFLLLVFIFDRRLLMLLLLIGHLSGSYRFYACYHFQFGYFVHLTLPFVVFIYIVKYYLRLPPVELVSIFLVTPLFVVVIIIRKVNTARSVKILV